MAHFKVNGTITMGGIQQIKYTIRPSKIYFLQLNNLHDSDDDPSAITTFSKVDARYGQATFVDGNLCLS